MAANSSALGHKLRCLEWLIEEPVPDPEAIIYQILPYTPAAADRIIEHLCALAGLDLEQKVVDPGRAQSVRRAFEFVVDGARIWEAVVKQREIEKQIDKPPWRTRLPALRSHRREFGRALRDKSVRLALRFALIRMGHANRAGRRWLHYLYDHPPVLRQAIDRALHDRMLQKDSGLNGRVDRVLLVEGVARAYRHLTGQRLSRSVTTDTKSRMGGQPTGPGLRLVQICLQPLDPGVSIEGIAWAIRCAQSMRSS